MAFSDVKRCSFPTTKFYFFFSQLLYSSLRSGATGTSSSFQQLAIVDFSFENFQKKIDAAINKSQTFVQIISDISFQPIGENWCLYEYGGYSKFLKDLKEQNLHYYEEVFNNNFFFLVMGNDMKDVKPPIFLNEETESWFQKIEATHLKFFSTANDFNSFNESIRNLSLAIFATKKKLIEAIPA